MNDHRILALSSSRVGNSGYLEFAAPEIKDFLGPKPINIAFIPFAAVTNDYEHYHAIVQEGLKQLGYNIQLVTPGEAKATLSQADAIMVGGGNTFKLLHDLYALDLVDLVKTKVARGTPYVGWSAGANIAGATICTTNDMPIIQPLSFTSLGFFSFQLNPHYINQKVEGHNGETRDERLTEFTQLNPGIPVVGLPEGSLLRMEGENLYYKGMAPAVMFIGKNSQVSREEISPGTDLTHLQSQSMRLSV
ncbi:dipeptidase PepE [Segetibacter sp. 3557_3]|uniref:dipeptidase PepE n=1 Tax=Segetibacter sp. 3557_3 TaxID=2547429 RepID=UPI0014052FA1|nr:dipeptidase PepE [Segetibacter sp. 3557_3]